MTVPYSVVLASGSPRRKELLLTLFREFEVVVSNVDEEALTSYDPVQTAKDLALAKAKAVAELRPDSLVIGGDTVVALESDRGVNQLSKPATPEQAVEMLERLSGKTHQVITGVALVWPTGDLCFSEVSNVDFRVLSRTEVEAYVATGEPMDKAGAYAIQGGAAGFVHNLDGSISNVVGLPLEALSSRLEGLWPTLP